jgi:hypothetical protein
MIYTFAPDLMYRLDLDVVSSPGQFDPQCRSVSFCLGAQAESRSMLVLAELLLQQNEYTISMSSGG